MPISQASVHVSVFQGKPFWAYPIFDPPPNVFTSTRRGREAAKLQPRLRAAPAALLHGHGAYASFWAPERGGQNRFGIPFWLVFGAPPILACFSGVGCSLGLEFLSLGRQPRSLPQGAREFSPGMGTRRSPTSELKCRGRNFSRGIFSEKRQRSASHASHSACRGLLGEPRIYDSSCEMGISFPSCKLVSGCTPCAAVFSCEKEHFDFQTLNKTWDCGSGYCNKQKSESVGAP